MLFGFGAMELLAKIEFLLMKIFRVFPIQHSFQAAIIVEQEGLIRDVLAFPYPARVGRSDRRIAPGARSFSDRERPDSQRFH